MLFRLLGPVEVEIEGHTLTLPRRRDRCLLGILLLEANRAVPVDRLTTLLWDNHPPEKARPAIHRHISRIRATLPPNGHVNLTTLGDGYRLATDPHGIDAHQFQFLHRQGVTATDPTQRINLLTAALALWRGPALDNTATDWLRHHLCANLEEQRITAFEDLITAHLTLHREREILPELTRIAHAHPGRESLTELHMRVLYQAGRKTDALEAYHHTRAYLTSELGIDPGPRLRELHRSILRDQLTIRSPTTTPAIPPAAATPPAPPATVPRQLPADVPGFTGRSSELAQLQRCLPTSATTPVVVATISGTAGIGKTALAVHWAHRAAAHFPHGQLYVNLRGYDPEQPLPPADALRGFLAALHAPVQHLSTSLDALAGEYRSRLAGRRMLIVLDNARDSDQVRPLLPGAAGCLALVTSRRQLSRLAVEGAVPVTLDLLTHPEARQLLERRLGRGRVAAEPVATDEIIARCARLPLALSIVAARAAVQSRFALSALADQLRAVDSGLAGMTDPDTDADLPTVLSWSYRGLPAAAARLFRLLGLHPGPDLSTAAAASLAGVSPDQARSLLAELVHTHLLAEHAPSRYEFHDVLRRYAADLAASHDTAANRRAARHRLLDHYRHGATAAARQLVPYHSVPPAPEPPQPGTVLVEPTDHPHAEAWFTAERRNLVTAVEHAAEDGFPTHAWQLAHQLAIFLDTYGHWDDYVATQRTAVRAAQQLADGPVLAQAHRWLGNAYTRTGRHQAAREELRQALAQFGRLGDLAGQGQTRFLLVALETRLGKYGPALRHARKAYALLRQAGGKVAQARGLNAIGWMHAMLGQLPEALRYCRHALAIQEQLDDALGAACTLDSLGYCHHRLGDHPAAVRCYLRALDLYDRTESRLNRAETLHRLGDAHRAAGQLPAAREAWQHAVDLLDHLKEPTAAEVRAKLGRLGCSPASG